MVTLTPKEVLLTWCHCAEEAVWCHSPSFFFQIELGPSVVNSACSLKLKTQTIPKPCFSFTVCLEYIDFIFIFFLSRNYVAGNMWKARKQNKKRMSKYLKDLLLLHRLWLESTHWLCWSRWLVVTCGD